MKKQPGRRRGYLAALSVLILIAVSSAEAAPPVDESYFTMFLGLETATSWQPMCVSFTETEICVQTDEGDLCGSWFYTRQGGTRSEISFTIETESDGIPAMAEGRARIENRGAKDSLGGTGWIVTGNRSLNFGLAGRSSKRQGCARLVRNFLNDPVNKNPACMERADFGDPTASPYVLPYPVGDSYRVSGGYCQYNQHVNSIAYDFAMPIGAEVVAVRAGTVVMVWEDTPDEPDEARPNGLFIEHEDGTVGSYAHITQDGVLVEVGERVEQGQVIAIGGTSGTSLPHLHFMVYRSYPTHVEDDDVAVNFSNARGPLDEHGGLMWGYRYRALAD